MSHWERRCIGGNLFFLKLRVVRGLPKSVFPDLRYIIGKPGRSRDGPVHFDDIHKVGVAQFSNSGDVRNELYAFF